MRDLLIKNLTSEDRRRRVIASCETNDKEGMHSVIRRHFICAIKEIADIDVKDRPLPYVYVLKHRNTKEQKERFFCKIKSNILAVHEGRIFLIIFMHTLSITLAAIKKQGLV